MEMGVGMLVKAMLDASQRNQLSGECYGIV